MASSFWACRRLFFQFFALGDIGAREQQALGPGLDGGDGANVSPKEAGLALTLEAQLTATGALCLQPAVHFQMNVGLRPLDSTVVNSAADHLRAGRAKGFGGSRIPASDAALSVQSDQNRGNRLQEQLGFGVGSLQPLRRLNTVLDDPGNHYQAVRCAARLAQQRDAGLHVQGCAVLVLTATGKHASLLVIAHPNEGPFDLLAVLRVDDGLHVIAQ